MPSSFNEYNRERAFAPTAKVPARPLQHKASKQLVFVVQRHFATHIHYDFRLELEGTLKSWVVPRGPSLNPADKRLAVMVEDHVFEYKDFYGSIPEGNYGAGDVEIWDEGFYYPVDEEHQPITEAMAVKHLNKGELNIFMAGTHLHGEFALIRLRRGGNKWLLIKHSDHYATGDEYDAGDIKAIRSNR